MDSRPRILIVSTVHTPLDARIHFRQVRSLLADGWQVTQAGCWADRGIVPPALGEHFDTVELPRSAGKRRSDALVAARHLLIERRDDFDLVLVHDPELLLAVAGQTDRLPPVVWDVHEDTSAATIDKPWLPQSLRGLARSATAAAERWAERHVHLILAEDGYRPRFAGEHPVVHNYPWVPRTPPVPVDRDRPRVVYVGRISNSRGAQTILRAAGRLSDRCELVLVGAADSDVEEALLDAHHGGTVNWLGFRPNTEALEMLAGATCGLALLSAQPNHLVSLPTKVVEYAGRGVASVTTPIPAAARFVTDNDCGVVVDFDDADALVASVGALLDDPDRADQLGRCGWQAASDRFDWHDEGRRFSELLRTWAR